MGSPCPCVLNADMQGLHIESTLHGVRGLPIGSYDQRRNFPQRSYECPVASQQISFGLTDNLASEVADGTPPRVNNKPMASFRRTSFTGKFDGPGSNVLSAESIRGDTSNEVDADARTSLYLVSGLCNALAAGEIVYCHWKSNAALDRSARGDNDLDLLVSRTDAQVFTQILYRLGFKEARVPSAQELPGVLNYYGYDRKTDRLVHVHAHYQLILGHDMTKNYRLPIEKPFLASATQGRLFKVPAPEFEFIVFVLRMVLKHSTWEPLLCRQGALPSAARRELEYLEPLVNRTRIHEILKQHLPIIDAAFFDDCMRSLRPDCPIWTRAKIAYQLQKRLQACARRPHLLDACLKVWRRLIGTTRRRILKYVPRKRLASGGAIIALVGGDGAGKSTAVDELHAWLSKDFSTMKAHFGNPPWSWTTFAVRGAVKVGSWLDAFLYRKSWAGTGKENHSRAIQGYSQLLRNICTARDRYRTYAKARRFSTNGGFVIADRFPLPQVKLIDGARSDLTKSAGQTHRLVKFLVWLEKSYYQPMMLPDLLIVLRVDPETAVRRKTHENAALVRARCREFLETEWGEAPDHFVDASRSKAEVLSDLKSLVWSAL